MFRFVFILISFHKQANSDYSLTVFEINFFPLVIHKIGPIKAIIEIRIQADFEPLNSLVEIRNIALKVVIIDQKHKTINDKINICFI